MENDKEFNIDEFNEEMKKMDENFTHISRTGAQNILNYFDRIHSKLFSLNNMLIAGYFALSQLHASVNNQFILFPVLNMVLLVWIDYKMMNISRVNADIQNKNLKQIQDNNKSVSSTNLISLLSIITTATVLAIFLLKLLTI